MNPETYNEAKTALKTAKRRPRGAKPRSTSYTQLQKHEMVDVLEREVFAHFGDLAEKIQPNGNCRGTQIRGDFFTGRRQRALFFKVKYDSSNPLFEKAALEAWIDETSAKIPGEFRVSYTLTCTRKDPENAGATLEDLANSLFDGSFDREIPGNPWIGTIKFGLARRQKLNRKEST